VTERPEYTEPDTRSLERRVFDARRQEIERRIDELLARRPEARRDEPVRSAELGGKAE
jgi:hypothetical protein